MCSAIRLLGAWSKRRSDSGAGDGCQRCLAAQHARTPPAFLLLLHEVWGRSRDKVVSQLPGPTNRNPCPHLPSTDYGPCHRSVATSSWGIFTSLRFCSICSFSLLEVFVPSMQAIDQSQLASRSCHWPPQTMPSTHTDTSISLIRFKALSLMA